MGAKKEYKEINSLYYLKGICAFLVVCCHAPWLGVFNAWISPLRTAAVPFFFTISGYFLYRTDLMKMCQTLFKSLKKLAFLILLCNTAYILLTLPNHGWTITTWEQVVDLIVYGRTVIEHLWYLTACFWGILFYWFSLSLLSWLRMDNKKRVKFFTRLCYAVLPLYLLAVVAVAYSPWTYEVWGWSYYPFSAIPYAVPFLALGFLIRQYGTLLLQRSWLPVAGFMLLLLFAEFILCCNLRGQSVMSLLVLSMPFVATSFLFFLQREGCFSRDSKLVLVGRKYSGNIYYWHMAMMTVGMKIAAMLSIPGYVYDWMAAPVVFILSLAWAILVVKLQDKLSLHIFP